MNKEIIKSKEKDLMRHAKAFEAAHRSFECLVRLLEICDSDDELIKSALFTALIIQYGRTFKGNERNGRLEVYPIKKLQSKIDFNKTLHKNLLTIRDRFVAHQDWDVEGRGLAKSVAKGDINGKAFKFIAEQSLVVTSLGWAKKEVLIDWHKHIESVCSGLLQLTYEALSELVNLGGNHADLFEIKEIEASANHSTGPMKFSGGSELTLPSVQSLPLARLAVKKSNDYIGGQFVYRYFTASKHVDSIKINEGTNDELKIELSRKEVKQS
jgi:hypothetical protein